jgi:hypothetical protein
VLRQPKCLNDEGEVDKRHEHHIEFLEPGEDAAKAFETAK